MQFPRITCLADVEPHVSYERGFIVSRRDEYTVVDYVYTTDETFTSDLALECRGLKFDRGGRLIARPFHKFFNIGERQRPEEIDWSAPHVVLDKLDGSMVHPCLIDGALVFMTRMGVTPQSRAALALAGAGVRAFCAAMISEGRTPVFEFTSPENRVVIGYDKPHLTLLAVRRMEDGAYATHGELVAAAAFGIPVVASLGPVTDYKAFIAATRARTGIEGYVVAFDDGHRLKLKTDAYVLHHRALSAIGAEKNVLAWVRCSSTKARIVFA